MKRIMPYILSISINVSSQIALQGNRGLSYPLAVEGYEVALYEYWEVIVSNNTKG